MKLSSSVKAFADLFEKEHGQRPTMRALQIAEKATRLINRMETLGKFDTKVGREPIMFATCEAIAQKIKVGKYIVSPGVAKEIAEYMYRSYQKGYGEKM